MYEQICNILKQNRISFKDFLWSDKFGKLQLNDSEDWIEYVEDNIDQGVYFYFAEVNKYYKYLQQVQLGFTNVMLLEEIKKEEKTNE
jgi:hypothetical protein